MIISEENTKEESLLTVAKAMMTAIRTAPKARGIDNIETCVVSGTELNTLAARMREIGTETGMKFFLRDADNIEHSSCVVLIGARRIDYKLNCGQCGFPTCKERKEQHPETPCVFVFINQGIAIGSAVSIAADSRVDNRVMFSAGVAARDLSLIEGCTDILAIPLSSSAKSVYFDRQ